MRRVAFKADELGGEGAAQLRDTRDMDNMEALMHVAGVQRLEVE